MRHFSSLGCGLVATLLPLAASAGAGDSPPDRQTVPWVIGYAGTFVTTMPRPRAVSRSTTLYPVASTPM